MKEDKSVFDCIIENMEELQAVTLLQLVCMYVFLKFDDLS